MYQGVYVHDAGGGRVDGDDYDAEVFEVFENKKEENTKEEMAEVISIKV